MERLREFMRRRAEKSGSPFALPNKNEQEVRTDTITDDDVARASQTLKEYKRGKASLEARIVENEQWYKSRHWEQVKGRSANEPKSASAWLFNSLANKHADAMDNYPEPVVLPREQSDEKAAQVLCDVLPVVLEQNDFEQVYSDMWWYKLKTGTGVMGVFWDSRKLNGLGDITIRSTDLLNLFWEPGISDIQDSRNLFHVELIDSDILHSQYPEISFNGTDFGTVATYAHDESIDTSKKCEVVDWYYKKFVNGRDVLHYCKFCAGHVLYASENDAQYSENGFYDHGLYPYIFDSLFPVAGSPAGFGYVDICKLPQLYIDSLDTAILENAKISAKARYFVRGDGAINEDEFRNINNSLVHFVGGGNPMESIMPINPPVLSAAALNVRQAKIEELKETSGNRDFSQGGTSSGVTAASAIAALQEAGSKLSRDMIKASYRAFAHVNTLCIELMRQFYNEPRFFRITGADGSTDFAQFSSAQIAPQTQGADFGLDMGSRLPVFDVRVISQKSSPFSTAAQNERAKELYAMGFFLPQNADQSLAALDMMSFEGIDKVKKRISQNGTLLETVQQLQAQMMQMATILDAQNGTTIAPNMQGAFGGQDAVVAGNATGGTGDEVSKNIMANTAGGARLRAAEASVPR